MAFATSNIVVTRRSILAGAAAAAALPAAFRAVGGGPAVAAGNSPKIVNAKSYRFHVGDIAVTVFHDGVITMPPATLADGIGEAEIAEALRNAYLAPGNLQLGCNVVMVDTGKNKVLFDVGGGLVDAGSPTLGQLVTTMKAENVDPASIDTVIFSHFHPDHVGGLRATDGSEAFPNATFRVNPIEWDFWSQDVPDMSKLKVPTSLIQFVTKVAKEAMPLIKTRMDTYGHDKEVLPGITSISAPGHTPGQSAFLLASGNEQLILTADAIHHYAMEFRPSSHPIIDVDVVKAEESKLKILNRASADRIPILSYHFPFPGVGHVRDLGSKTYEWIPSPWWVQPA